MIIGQIYKKLCLKKAENIFSECKEYILSGLLDVGAGRGYIANRISKEKGMKVQCIDVKDFNMSDLPMKIYDGKKIPYAADSYNTVLLCYVLHHAENPEELLKECIRVSKKRIIIFEDNADSKLTKILDFIFNKLHGVDTPLNFKTYDEWIETFKKLKLKTVKIKRRVEKQWFYPGVEHIMFVIDKR
jgi:ubiquinone/menaquinone biosynthesis C-methylase UbiE